MSLRKELLSIGKEALEAIKLPFKIKSEKKSLEQWILDKQAAIAVKEYDITAAKQDKELNVDKILDMVDDLDIMKRRLAQGEDLMVELFGAE